MNEPPPQSSHAATHTTPPHGPTHGQATSQPDVDAELEPPIRKHAQSHSCTNSHTNDLVNPLHPSPHLLEPSALPHPRLAGHAPSAHVALFNATNKSKVEKDDAIKPHVIPTPKQWVPQSIVLLWRQLANAMTVILLAACAVAFGTREYPEGAVIIVVIVVNVAVGWVQDWKAEKSMRGLSKLSSPTAFVLRPVPLHLLTQTTDTLEGLDVDLLAPHAVSIDTSDLIPGDAVLLRPGAIVPADMRIVGAVSLKIDEANLTGESLPVEKRVGALQKKNDGAGGEVPLGDRKNMAWWSTTVVSGRGVGIVTATGAATELGKIALLLMQGKSSCAASPTAAVPAIAEEESDSDVKEEPVKKQSALRKRWAGFKEGLKTALGLRGTILQIKLTKMSLCLLALAILLAIIVFSASKFKVDGDVALYAIAVALAIYPEALIAVVTVTMASGSRRMSTRKTIVRRLDALEALGGCAWICTDKTGTLTTGHMAVVKLWKPDTTTFPGASADVEKIAAQTQEKPLRVHSRTTSTSSASTAATATPDSGEVMIVRPIVGGLTPDKEGWTDRVLRVVALCNSASVNRDTETGEEEREQNGDVRISGDPTESALLRFAHNNGLNKDVLLGKVDSPVGTTAEKQTLLHEWAFDSSLKRMTVAYREEPTNSIVYYMKGAVEHVFAACNKGAVDEDKVMKVVESFAKDGLRVLAMAMKKEEGGKQEWVQPERAQAESGLEFVGLIALQDPPRPESFAAVQACKKASIAVTMVTGDHKLTATSIARQVGIIDANSPASAVMTASELEAMIDAAGGDINKVTIPAVVARCSPTTKVRVVQQLHKMKKIVAMSGDGTNDAPSLKLADIGIAMGSGTDVAREASELVLLDNNFMVIVNAVEEGRRILDNLCKFLLHLLSSNASEVLVLICGLAFTDPSGRSVYPLSPIQVLYENLITSAFPSLGLGFEQGDALTIMSRPPRQQVFDREFVCDVIVYGLVMGLAPLINFIIVVYGPGKGLLGEQDSDCNDSLEPGCDPAFRARATVFASLSMIILLHGLTCKNTRRSLFSFSPKELYQNKFLFYAVVFGLVSIFPCIYIPVLNEEIFKQSAITWEWGLAFASIAVYLAAAESWKAFKRAHWKEPEYMIRRPPSTVEGEVMEVEKAGKEKV